MCEKKIRTLQDEVDFPAFYKRKSQKGVYQVLNENSKSEPLCSIRIQPQDKKRPKSKIYGHHRSFQFPCSYPVPLEPF